MTNRPSLFTFVAVAVMAVLIMALAIFYYVTHKPTNPLEAESLGREQKVNWWV